MLKGKKGIYVLIPINILIWGFFIYRFYTLYHESDDVEIKEAKVSITELGTKDSVSYKLNLAYDDPFLKKGSSAGATANGSSEMPKRQGGEKNVVKKEKPKEEPTRVMPDIKYLGLVKNNTSGSVTAIVSINGSSKLVKQDETIDGLSFKNITMESLTVLWNKEKLIISK